MIFVLGMTTNYSFFENLRDVDYFIEKLRSTIQFFVKLESPQTEDGSAGDDFVPFI